MNVAITSIQRNRGRWLKEWIAFHYLVGFNQFYIYLHECSDNSREVLLGLAKKVDIEIIDVDPNIENPQLKCYQMVYEQYGNDVDWMAFIDGDEFLFPTHAKTMQEPLSLFTQKELSALGVYWSCFGSSGHVKEPNGLVIENYTHRAKDDYDNNRHIKSIVKGHQVGSIIPMSPHMFKTPLGTFDENLRPIEKGWTDYNPTYNHFRINHYVTQSREFFDTFKSKVIPPDGAVIRDESFWNEHNKNDIVDTSMNRFVQPLKELLRSL